MRYEIDTGEETKFVNPEDVARLIFSKMKGTAQKLMVKLLYNFMYVYVCVYVNICDIYLHIQVYMSVYVHEGSGILWS